MKNSIFFILGFFLQNVLFAQLNVYELNQPFTDVTNAQLNNNAFNPISGVNLLFDISPSYNYNGNIQKMIIADNSISLKDNGHFRANNNGSIHFKIENENNSVFCFSHDNLTQIRSYDKFELGIDLPYEIAQSINNFFFTEDSNLYLNPFLDWDVEVRCKFKHLNSSFEQVVTGYYGLDYERQPALETWQELATLYPFRIRYAFPEKFGIWTNTIELWINGELHTSYTPFNVNVVPNPDNDGYVKVGTNKQTFSLKDELFLPYGHNLKWPDILICTYEQNPCGSHNHQAFMENLEEYAANGPNSYKLILNPATLDIEFEKIGNYRQRLNYAWEIDQIIQKSEELGLYIDLNFMIQYSLIAGGPYALFRWDFEDAAYPGYVYEGYSKEMYCYGRDLGIVEPSEFLTDERAKKFYKQKIRYLISRYGYSTNIFLFELQSEINTVGDHYFINLSGKNVSNPLYDNLKYQNNIEKRNNVYQWHKEMSEFIKNKLNHKQHLLACSYAGPIDVEHGDLTPSIPELDVIGYNRYPSGNMNFMEDYVAEIKDLFDNYQKPVIFGETGPLFEYKCDDHITYKQHIWRLPFSGLAGFFMWEGEKAEYYQFDVIEDVQYDYNFNNRPLWQELRSMKNWILQDPELVFAFKNSFRAVNMSTNLKEVNLIVGKKDAQVHKLFGAFVNLTDNYFTNSPYPISSCRTPFVNDENKIAPFILSPLRNKTNLYSYTIPYLDPNTKLPPENYTFDWSNITDFNAHQNTYHDYYYDNYIFDHPLSCITEACLNDNPYSTIMPFKSIYAELAEDPEYFIQNNEMTSKREENAFLLEPNPGQEVLRITNRDENSEELCYKIIDLNGKTIAQQNSSDSVHLNTTDLEYGVYFIQIYKNSKLIETQKWLKTY